MQGGSLEGLELVEIVDGTLDFEGVLSEDLERYIQVFGLGYIDGRRPHRCGDRPCKMDEMSNYRPRQHGLFILILETVLPVAGHRQF
jgi:hypothetical protein